MCAWVVGNGLACSCSTEMHHCTHSLLCSGFCFTNCYRHTDVLQQLAAQASVAYSRQNQGDFKNVAEFRKLSGQVKYAKRQMLNLLRQRDALERDLVPGWVAPPGSLEERRQHLIDGVSLVRALALFVYRSLLHVSQSLVSHSCSMQ
jgi:hypothetical protein